MEKYTVTFFSDAAGEWITRRVTRTFESYGAARVWAANNMNDRERSALVEIDF